MVNLVLSVLIAAIIAVGYVDTVKNLIPLGQQGKTIVGIIFEVLVGVGVSLVGALFDKTSVVTGVLRAIIIAVGTVGVAQVFYNYIASFITSIKDKLKK